MHQESRLAATSHGKSQMIKLIRRSGDASQRNNSLSYNMHIICSTTATSASLENRSRLPWAEHPGEPYVHRNLVVIQATQAPPWRRPSTSLLLIDHWSCHWGVMKGNVRLKRAKKSRRFGEVSGTAMSTHYEIATPCQVVVAHTKLSLSAAFHPKWKFSSPEKKILSSILEALYKRQGLRHANFPSPRPGLFLNYLLGDWTSPSTSMIPSRCYHWII